MNDIPIGSGLVSAKLANVEQKVKASEVSRLQEASESLHGLISELESRLQPVTNSTPSDSSTTESYFHITPYVDSVFRASERLQKILNELVI